MVLEIEQIIKKYRDPSPDLGNIRIDFQRAAEAIPRTLIADGVAAPCRSCPQTFGEVLSNLFKHSNVDQRSRVLKILIPALSDGSQHALAGAGLFTRSGADLQIVSDSAMSLSPEALQVAGNEAAMRDPRVVDRTIDFYSRFPCLLKQLPTDLIQRVLGCLANSPALRRNDGAEA